MTDQDWLDLHALERAVHRVTQGASYSKAWTRRIARYYREEMLPPELRPRTSGDCPVCGKWRANLHKHLAMHDEFRREAVEVISASTSMGGPFVTADSGWPKTTASILHESEVGR